MNKGDDPYVILGVPYDAEESKIKKAYFKLARVHHPDKQTTEADKEKHGAIFSKISDAYDLLNDPVRRYDWKSANETRMKAKQSNPHKSVSQMPSAPRRSKSAVGPQRQSSTSRSSSKGPMRQSQQRPGFKRQNSMFVNRPPPPSIDMNRNSFNNPRKNNSGHGASPPMKHSSSGTSLHHQIRPGMIRQNSMPRNSVSRPKTAPQRTSSGTTPGQSGSPANQLRHSVHGTPSMKRQNSMSRAASKNGPPKRHNSIESSQLRDSLPQRPGFKRMHSMQPNRGAPWDTTSERSSYVAWPTQPNPQQAPMQGNEENPFDVLGIHYMADRVEIIHAYRLLSQKYHPTKQKTEDSRAHCVQKTAQIHRAYDSLKDPTQKMEWQIKSRASIAKGGEPRRMLKTADTSKKSIIQQLSGNKGKRKEEKPKKTKDKKKKDKKKDKKTKKEIVAQ